MSAVNASHADAALAGGLERALCETLGDVEVTDLVRLKGGYSRETWSFDADLPDGRRLGLILCADHDKGVVGRVGESLDRVTEGRLLAELHGLGLPVPAVYATADAHGPLGRPFLVMARIDGIVAVGPLVRDAWYRERRTAFAAQKASILARIHGAGRAVHVLGDDVPNGGDCGRRELSRWAAALAHTEEARTPAVDRALGWLESRLPVTTSVLTVVHGDYRVGNLVYGPEGIRSVLDWEMAHVGDPLEDVAWAQLVCWRVGTPLVGGLVDEREWVSLYEHAWGSEVDAERLRFWDVLGAVKMACLAWRAVEATPPGPERNLLVGLFEQLDAELERLG